MDRRKFLSVTGIAGITTLTGCQTARSVIRSGPPHFEEVEVTGPSEVAVGEKFSLTVTAKNTGGRQGDFTNTLTIGQGALSANTNVKIKNIGITKTKSTEIGPFHLGYADEYQFRITDYDASHTISVTTNEQTTSEEFRLENGPAITIQDISYKPSVLYDAKYQDGLLTPSSGRMLAVIQLSITNQGETKSYLGPNSFEVENGRHITEIDQLGISLRDIQDVENQPLNSDTILPGETKQGWLLASVTTDTAKNGLRVAWNRDSGSSDPEVRWTHAAGDIPIYEVAEVDFPNEVEIGTETEGTITVKNTGSASGTFQGIVERRNSGETAWQRVETFSLELAAGSSSSHTIPVQEPYLGPSQYRIRPDTVTRTVDFVPATRTLGGSYTNPSGANILANIGGFDFDGLTSKYIYESWENKMVEASDGNTFALVKVSVENTATESISFPAQGDFTLVSGGEEYSVAQAVPYGTATFVSPMEGEEYSIGWSYESGETDSGWLVFEIPDNISKEQLTVRYTPSEKITVEWSASH